MNADRRMVAIADRIQTELVEARAHAEAMRMVEAVLFASAAPLTIADLAERLPAGTRIARVLEDLAAFYSARGVNLVRIGDAYAFRTAGDLSWLMASETVEPRKLSRAALETLAIIAYHQPVTRAEIEDIRGVSTSKGTLDTLIEAGFVRLRGRRRAPGRPVTYGTTPAFLDHFGLSRIDDLPGLEELRGSGFFEGRVPSALSIPTPSDDAELREDEDPLDDADLFAPLEPEEDEGAGEGDEEGR